MPMASEVNQLQLCNKDSINENPKGEGLESFHIGEHVEALRLGTEAPHPFPVSCPVHLVPSGYS